MQDLVEKVWGNKRFHSAAKSIEIAWLCREINVESFNIVDAEDVKKALQASAILACSSDVKHRRAAYRLATSAYELIKSTVLPLEQALRVILTRLDNFPSLLTRRAVANAAHELPISLAAEEAFASEQRELLVAGKIFHLTRFQHELWTRLVSGGRVAVAAPTSAGKSFVLQNFLSSLFVKKAAVVVYIVPTRALISQVADDLSSQFKSDGDQLAPEIITIPLDAGETIPGKVIFVMTQERVQLLLASHEQFCPDVIVVDEAHSISDGSRGVLLQTVIDELLRKNPTVQLLFASPLIRNLDMFGRLFGVSDIFEITSVEPTVAQNFVLVTIDHDEAGKLEISTVGDGEEDSEFVGVIRISKAIQTRVDQLVNIAIRLGAGAVNIIYANGADEAERIAIKLAEALKKRKSTAGRDALAELATESVHSSYEMAKCVKRGVAFHYGEVPAVLRRAVESAVSNGHIDYLVCTSTLLQGVNLPAKNIFLCKPEKGSNRPLKGTDFWNLAGRAGRLLKEFQGNIFLIEYARWKEKPLSQPKDQVVIPAMETGVFGNVPDLVCAIKDMPYPKVRDNHDIESVFVRLLSDYRRGLLSTTIERLDGSESPAVLNTLMQALKLADSKISLPESILRHSPNISGHKQQALYDAIIRKINGGRSSINEIIPPHPKHKDAYSVYVTILVLCHQYIQGQEDAEGLSKFQAVMAIKWMKGTSLPQIIDNQIQRSEATDTRGIIRDVLGIIEREIRFKLVRLFGCFLSLLKHALEQTGRENLAAGIVPITLFLEVGASDRTMISLMSLGLSRVSAKKLNEKSSSKNMDVQGVRSWLKHLDLHKLGLTELLIEEVQKVISYR